MGSHGKGQFGEDLENAIQELKDMNEKIIRMRVEEAIRKGKQGELSLE